jgi:hypothetical protein
MSSDRCAHADVADLIKRHGRHRLEELTLATAYTDIRIPLAEASFELGLDPKRVGNAVGSKAGSPALFAVWISHRIPIEGPPFGRQHEVPRGQTDPP